MSWRPDPALYVFPEHMAGYVSVTRSTVLLPSEWLFQSEMVYFCMGLQVECLQFLLSELIGV